MKWHHLKIVLSCLKNCSAKMRERQDTNTCEKFGGRSGLPEQHRGVSLGVLHVGVEALHDPVLHHHRKSRTPHAQARPGVIPVELVLLRPTPVDVGHEGYLILVHAHRLGPVVVSVRVRHRVTHHLVHPPPPEFVGERLVPRDVRVRARSRERGGDAEHGHLPTPEQVGHGHGVVGREVAPVGVGEMPRTGPLPRGGGGGQVGPDGDEADDSGW
mmetsp:Transcript_54802/g.116457  ORF Transcript_54802/g.116457 Transcript_54802/m.116457 type:complete len:214 (-) Transcript_54802:191-832(-)